MNVIADIIIALATLVTAIGTLLVSYWNSRKIEEVHRSTNGKMEQLVSEVRTASFAAGKKAEKDENN